MDDMPYLERYDKNNSIDLNTILQLIEENKEVVDTISLAIKRVEKMDKNNNTEIHIGQMR